MTGVLFNLLHERAEKSFTKTVTKENYSEWTQHYLNTCKAMADEFRKCGLTMSALEMDRIHKEQSKIARPKND